VKATGATVETRVGLVAGDGALGTASPGVVLWEHDANASAIEMATPTVRITRA
jgi:hypothetical protein